MSEKRFPLPLSAVVDQGDASRRLGSARPQTAMKNVADQHKISQEKRMPLRPSAPVKSALPSAESKKNPQHIPQSEALVSDKIRQAMVKRIAAAGVVDVQVLAAMENIPRHLFVESGLASQAYIDASLPIGYHQTISQPYIVARMIEVLRDGQNLSRVLEIGTGCGYQAAVLSELAGEVFSIERIQALHTLAKNNLRSLRIANLRLHYGDGMLGLPQVAPFDGIILAAAGLEIPDALLQQMAVGGRLVAPVGARQQVLQVIVRRTQSQWESRILERCHFVPLHQGVI